MKAAALNIILYEKVNRLTQNTQFQDLLYFPKTDCCQSSDTHTHTLIFTQNNLSAHLGCVEPASSRWNLFFKAVHGGYEHKGTCFHALWSCGNTATRCVWLRSEVKVTFLGRKATLILSAASIKAVFFFFILMREKKRRGTGLLFSSHLKLRVWGKSLRWHRGNLWSVNMYYCYVNVVGRFWWSSKRD